MVHAGTQAGSGAGSSPPLQREKLEVEVLKETEKLKIFLLPNQAIKTLNVKSEAL